MSRRLGQAWAWWGHLNDAQALWTAVGSAGLATLGLFGVRVSTVAVLTFFSALVAALGVGALVLIAVVLVAEKGGWLLPLERPSNAPHGAPAPSSGTPAEVHRPRIELDDVPPAVLLYESAVPKYRLQQVWFKNSDSDAIAKDVSAKVTVINERHRVAFLECVCGWAIGGPPTYQAPRFSLSATTDIAPNGLPGRLNVFLRYPRDQICYVISNEGRETYPDGRDPKLAVLRGRFLVSVTLAGSGCRRSSGSPS